jgi:hypothetical protein
MAGDGQSIQLKPSFFQLGQDPADGSFGDAAIFLVHVRFALND